MQGLPTCILESIFRPVPSGRLGFEVMGDHWLNMSAAPLCFLCSRYRDSYRCEAFPDGIPFDIIASNVDHRDQVEGDHGLQFIPVTEVAARYAEDLFSTPQGDPIPNRRRRQTRPRTAV